MAQQARAGEQRRVVVLGAGFGGAYAAKALRKRLPRGWQLTVIDRLIGVVPRFTGLA